ncbi:hypothetical protein P154DRAFT_442479, partial [Amniculicola lignicola CBS 123094]
LDIMLDSGTALGIVSVAFHTFSGCIKGCQLLIEAADMPQNYEYLRNRLRLEELKLLDWWVVSRKETEKDVAPNDKNDAIVATLMHIQALTLDMTKIRDQYGLVLQASGYGGPQQISEDVPTELPLAGEQKAIWRKALDHAAVSWKMCPQRVRWVLFDGAKFEQLLLRFTGLNDTMLQFLQAEERRHHYKIQEETHLRVLAMHHNVGLLQQLVQALHVGATQAPPLPNKDLRRDTNTKFAKLAKLKALNMDTESSTKAHLKSNHGTAQAPVAQCIDITHISFSVEPVGRDRSAQQAVGVYSDKAVWIEWKIVDVEAMDIPFSYVVERVSRLSILLQSTEKLEELPLPICLGYILDPGLNRIGLVFEASLSTQPLVPESLHQRLQTCMKPSLSIRVAMAQKLASGLNYLHATGWLHKSLRSDNILFHGDDNNEWLSFWVSGFEYARPADPDELTEQPSSDKTHELYRHPDVQFDVPRDGPYGFRAPHDVFSLGVVLLEIAVWQPVNHFLGVSLTQRLSRAIIRKSRAQLMDDMSLSIAEAEAGHRFAEAIRLCLASEVILEQSDDVTDNGEQEHLKIGVEGNCLGDVVSILGGIDV